MLKRWGIKKIKEIGEVYNGGTPSTQNLEFWDGNVLWCIPTDITKKKNKYIKDTERKISTKAIKHTGKLLPAGTILLCSRATIGEMAIANEQITTNQGFKNIIVNNDNYNEFIYYLLHTKKKQLIEKATGSTFFEISKKEVENLELKIPGKDEQIAISEIISNIDLLINDKSRLIEKKNLIKQGVMQELLTGKKRLPGFNNEWKQVELGSLGKIYNGLTGKTKNDFGWGNSKYVTFLNVLKNRKLNNKLFEKVNINEVQNFIRYGDLFFNTSSETPEEVALCSAFMDETEENIAVNSFCFGFRLNNLKSIYPLYLVDYFRSYEGRKKIIEIAQGSTRYNLSKEYFLKLLIPIPDYEEQKAISTMITDMDEEINLLEQDLDKYKQIKQGMMEQLLTGKIRLVKESDNTQTLPEKKHNQHFDDAVVFANIVASCYDPSYPLGRKKCQKMMYLFKRFNESSVDQFKHYAAGPYDNKARYGGFETIAIKNKYVVENKSDKGSSFAPGPEIEKAKAYCSKYGYDEFIPIFNQYLKYKKVDELELYTTVDKTILELKDQGSPINLNTVKSYISNDKTWVAKLSREVFNDKNIEEAIRFSQLVLGV